MRTRVDERCNPVERFFKPKVFEDGLHNIEGFPICVGCNFNGNIKPTIVGNRRASKWVNVRVDKS